MKNLTRFAFPFLPYCKGKKKGLIKWAQFIHMDGEEIKEFKPIEWCNYQINILEKRACNGT